MSEKDIDYQVNWRQILAAALIAAGVLFYLYYGVYKILFVHFDFVGVDFLHARVAAENYLAGRSLYADSAGVIQPAFYLPLVSVIFIPFCSLSEHGGRLLWFAVSHAMILISFAALYRLGRRRGRLFSAAAASVALLSSMPLYSIVQTGNINILIFGGLCFAYYLLVSGRPAAVPALLSFFSAVKIFPALLLAAFVRARDWRACRVFAFCLAAIVLVSLLIFGPAEHSAFLGKLFPLSDYVQNFHTMGFPFFARLFWPEIPRGHLLLSSAALLGMLLVLFLGRRVPGTADCQGAGGAVADLFAATAIMLLVMPSSWIMCISFFAGPFYLVVLSLLNGGHRLKYPGQFVLTLSILHLWEILYYQVPLPSVHVNMKTIFDMKESYPVLYPVIFSLHFFLLLALFLWVLVNRAELVRAAAELGRAAVDSVPAETRAK